MEAFVIWSATFVVTFIIAYIILDELLGPRR